VELLKAAARQRLAARRASLIWAWVLLLVPGRADETASPAVTPPPRSGTVAHHLLEHMKGSHRVAEFLHGKVGCEARRYLPACRNGSTCAKCTHAPALTAPTLKLAFEKMLTYATHLGLYAERISCTFNLDHAQ